MSDGTHVETFRIDDILRDGVIDHGRRAFADVIHARIFNDADNLEAVVVCRVIAEVPANRILAFQELADKSLVYDRNGGSFFVVCGCEISAFDERNANRIEEMLTDAPL